MSKNTFIITRTETPLKNPLIKLAGGTRNLSKLIRKILAEYVKKHEGN